MIEGLGIEIRIGESEIEEVKVVRRSVTVVLLSDLEG